MLFNFWVLAWLEDQRYLRSLLLLFELCFLIIVLNYLFSKQQNKMFCLSSYLCRIKWKENSSCSACGHPLQDLTHLLLDCPASEPLRRAIFGTTYSIFDLLLSRPWGVARLLGLCGVLPRPSLERGRVHHQEIN